MILDITGMLVEQLNLISNDSKNATGEELCSLTAAMMDIVRYLSCAEHTSSEQDTEIN